MFNRKIKYKTVTQTFGIWAILCLCAFDVRTYFVFLMPISIITSILFIILSLGFIAIYFFPNNGYTPKLKLREYDLFIALFVIVYGVRIIFNIYVEQIVQYNFNNRITYAFYYVYLCIIPYMICRRFDWGNIDIKQFYKILFAFFLFGLLMSLRDAFSILSSGNNAYMGRFGGNLALDTIGYGHMALTFIFVCVALMQFSSVRFRIILFCFVLFGLLSMGIANSRGPFVALLAILGLYIITFIRPKVIIGSILIVIVLVLNVKNIDVFFKEQFNSSFVERFMTIFEFSLNNSSGRDRFYTQGLDMFVNNPIFGRSILLLNGELEGGYVHNIILEVFMATGVIGGILFLIINSIALIHSVYLIKNKSKYSFFALVFIQYFIYLQFSRTLIIMPLYWLCLATVYSVYHLEKK